MALISCPKCGKQISSTAAACPHCGSSFEPEQPKVTVFQSDGMAGRSAANRPHTAPIIVGAIIAAALIALALYFFVFKGKENAFDPANNNAYARSDVYVPNEPEVKNYNVTLSVDCRENHNFNKNNNADILIDGKFLVTHPHGTSAEYNVSLAEGSHKIEFRVNGKKIGGADAYDKNDKGSYQIMTLNVTQDTVVSYYIKMTLRDNISVSIK